jgi:hypothetical protein
MTTSLGWRMRWKELEEEEFFYRHLTVKRERGTFK